MKKKYIECIHGGNLKKCYTCQKEMKEIITFEIEAYTKKTYHDEDTKKDLEELVNWIIDLLT